MASEFVFQLLCDLYQADVSQEEEEEEITLLFLARSRGRRDRDEARALVQEGQREGARRARGLEGS